MICPHCKKELEDGSLFCSYCGEKMEQKKQAFCTQCGAELDESATFCSKCGIAVNANVSAQQSHSSVGEATKPQKENPISRFQWSKVTAFLKRCGEICFALLCLLGIFIKEKAIPFVKKNAKVCAGVAGVLLVVIIVLACIKGATKPASEVELKAVTTTEYLLAEQVTYSKDGSIAEHFLYEYDEQGNKTLHKNVLRNAWQEWEYDEHGNLISEAEYLDNGVFAFCIEYDITYDKTGKREKTVSFDVDENGKKTMGTETESEYKYDRQDNLIYEKTTYADNPDSYMEIEYDGRGNTLRSYSHVIDQNGKPFIIELVYNENGDALKQYTSMYDETGKETFADIVNKYDKRGNLIHTAFNTDVKENCYTIECTYDGQGNQLSAITYDRNGNTVQEVQNQYDAHNNLIYENTIKADGTTRPIQYEYDGDGNLVKKTTYVKGAPFFVDVYTYDANGNKLSEVTTLEGGPYSSRMHTYDEHGNVIHTEKYFGPEYNGYITYEYTAVEKVTYVPVEELKGVSVPEETTVPQVEQSAEITPDVVVGSWVYWGSLYGWEDESYISNPIPEEELNIDGQGEPCIIVTEQGDDTYLFNVRGRETPFIYDEANNTFSAADETLAEEYGSYVLIDKNTIHLEDRGDISVYKKSEEEFASDVFAALDEDAVDMGITLDDFAQAFHEVRGSNYTDTMDLFIETKDEWNEMVTTNDKPKTQSLLPMDNDVFSAKNVPILVTQYYGDYVMKGMEIYIVRMASEAVGASNYEKQNSSKVYVAVDAENHIRFIMVGNNYAAKYMFENTEPEGIIYHKNTVRNLMEIIFKIYENKGIYVGSLEDVNKNVYNNFLNGGNGYCGVKMCSGLVNGHTMYKSEIVKKYNMTTYNSTSKDEYTEQRHYATFFEILEEDEA